MPADGAADRSWRALVASGGTIPIADLASATGYTRQHLARVVTALAGCTPTELVVGHVPFVQDVETAGR